MKGKKLSAKERRELIESNKTERAKCFKDLLAHVRTGYSIDCFGPISETMIRKYLKDYPEEFIEEDLLNAIRDAKGYWEGLGRRQADGTCLGNSRSWYYNMVNRYGWREKVQVEAEHSGNVNVNVVSYASQKARRDDEDKVST